MKSVTLVKLGGAVLTDKRRPQLIRRNLLEELVGQIQKSLPFFGSKLVIGNGGGSFGHYFAQKYGLLNGMSDEKGYLGFCEGKNANALLNRRLVDALIGRGMKACTYPMDSIFYDFGETGEAMKNWHLLFSYLTKEMIPVVYGDFVYDCKKGCRIISTEEIFSSLITAILTDSTYGYCVDKIVFCTDKDGVLDQAGQILPFIKRGEFKQWDIFEMHKKGYDVTGGMLGKVKMAMNPTFYFPVYIINGNYPERLGSLLRGNEVIGTKIY